MTEEQEAKIEKAINDSYKTGFTAIETLIIAGIKAYDDLKKEETTTNSEGYIIFRPCMRDLEDSMKECRYFNNIDEMLDTLYEENHGKNHGNIYIDEVQFKDTQTGWLYSQIVLCSPYENMEKSVVIGICDCKTFKKA